MSAPTWMRSEAELPMGFSATVESTEVLLGDVRLDGTSKSSASRDPRDAAIDDILGIAPPSGSSSAAAGSSSSSVRRSGGGGSGSSATLASRRAQKISKDLLAMVEEDTELDIDATTVTTNVRLAASTILKKRDANMRDVFRKIRHAQNVHLAFLVDTTGSMSAHIKGVCQQITDICAFLAKSTSGGTNTSGVAVAFVGYKDFCDGPNHFEVQPFTKNLAQFQSVVRSIVATGGGDGPEDVNGGLRKALDGLQWAEPGAANVLFHIGDAPPHGAQYSSMHSDDVSMRGVRDHDEPIATLFARMQQRGIDYYFGKINSSTDKMVQLFGHALGKTVAPFDVTNPADLTKCVTIAGLESVSSRVRESMCGAAVSPALLKPLVIDKTVPDFTKLATQKGSLVEYRFPDDLEHIKDYVEFGVDTRKALFKIAPRPFAQGSLRFAYYAQEFLPSAGDSVSATTTTLTTGSDGKKTTTWSVVDQVCKEFKEKGRTDLGMGTHERYRYMVDMEVQTIASFLALKYNQLQSLAKSDAGYKIRYLKSKVLAIVDPRKGRDGYTYFAVERKFREGEDKWVNVINNAGGVAAGTSHDDLADANFCEYLTAFAHWTHSATDGYLMVTDLQGIKLSSSSNGMASVTSSTSTSGGHVTPDTILLTDPAIHCTAKTRFGRTNLGKRGMKLFFDSHTCNRFCKALALKAPVVSAETEADDV